MGLLIKILATTYFVKLYRKDKFLFSFVLLFISLSIFANVIRLETTPFFLWNLYAERYYPRNEYQFIEVRYNDNKLLNIKHTWLSPQKEFLTGPLYNYLQAIKNGGRDPDRDYLENHWAVKHPAFKNMVAHLYNTSIEYNAFPIWYRNYLSSVKNEPIKVIYVLEKKVRFEQDGQVTGISTDTLLSIR